MLELAILGLLKEQELHGYELKRRLTHTLGLLSSVSFGSLYPALSRLEAAVQLQTKPKEPGRPNLFHQTSFFFKSSWSSAPTMLIDYSKHMTCHHPTRHALTVPDYERHPDQCQLRKPRSPVLGAPSLTISDWPLGILSLSTDFQTGRKEPVPVHVFT